MDIAASFFIGLTAVLHVGFFMAESMLFMRPRIMHKFDLDASEAAIIKPWAFNQGFYNLFLAIGLGYSIMLLNSQKVDAGHTLASFLLLYIVGAGIVLFLSVPRYRRFALKQAMPAILGLIFLLLM